MDIKGYRAFLYTPPLNYQGKDRVAFMVEFEGKRYKIAVDLVVEVAIGGETDYYCPPGSTKFIEVKMLSISEFSVGVFFSVAATPSTMVVDHAKGVYRQSIRPTTDAASYLAMLLGGDKDKNLVQAGGAFDGGKMTLVKAPQHGKLAPSSDKKEASLGIYYYSPEKDFSGTDRFVIQVEKSGVKITIHYKVEVYDTTQELSLDYRDPREWKMPTLSGNIEPGNRYETASLQALLTNAKASLTSFADLSGDKIALDTNAAGHSWFIDYTPYLNEEWLPTSNTYEWQAKPGSDAEGKMDLNSVVLHEYGHVLGLEHSTDSHDFMAATLHPGVRRLPSSYSSYG